MRIFLLFFFLLGTVWAVPNNVLSTPSVPTASDAPIVPIVSVVPTLSPSPAPTVVPAAPVAQETLMPQGQGGGDAAVKDLEIVRSTAALSITVHYPAIGVEGIDADVARWAEYMVEQFESSVAAEEREATAPPFVLDIVYKVEKPSPRAVSIVFDVGVFTGGAHGNLAIVSRTYDMQSGILLTPSHFFEDLEMALTLMSTYCYERLAEELGTAREESMLKSGTTPDADNFSTLSLNETGVRVHFAPYQVAPWSAGALFVDVPLAALVDAHPLLELWGRPALSAR